MLPDRSAPPRMESYDEERARFRPEVPEIYNPTIDIVERWGQETGDDITLVSLDGSGEVVAEHTAAELAELSRRAARALQSLGIGKGDRVFIMLPRVPAWYAAMLGVVRIGAVAMPGTNQLTSRDIAYRIKTAGAVAAITDAIGVEKIDAVAGELDSLRYRVAWSAPSASGWEDFDALIDPASDGALPEAPTGKDDPALLFFTSGTVSYAKMVMHGASYGAGHISTARFWHDLRPGDRHWTVSDTGWAKAAWGGLYGQFHERATVVQVALGKPDADTILSTSRRRRSPRSARRRRSTGCWSRPTSPSTTS
jgi:acyl-coenzyme A synthetase/AMP-(fatty) acid ligase